MENLKLKKYEPQEYPVHENYTLSQLNNAFKFEGFEGSYRAPKPKAIKRSPDVQFFKFSANNGRKYWGLLIH